MTPTSRSAGSARSCLDAYKTLGATRKTSGSPTPTEIERLADMYSKERNELSPKERVKLGS